MSHKWLQGVVQALQAANGAELAKRLTVVEPQYAGSALHLCQANEAEGAVKGASHLLPRAWSEIVTNIARARKAWTGSPRNATVACDEQRKALQGFLSNVLSSEEYADSVHIFLPVLNALARDCRCLAVTVDSELSARSQLPKKMNEAAQLLQKAFGATVRDNNADPSKSKRQSALAVANQIVRVYFHQHNYNQVRPVLRTLQSPWFRDSGTHPLQNFPAAQLVEHNFFIGRICLLNGEYDEARERLRSAFNRMPRGAPQKRRTLVYLVPLEMIGGRMPKERLLEKYGLKDLFWELTKALVAGNVPAFEALITRREQEFVRNGTYLLLEKLKMLAFRNLVRRVHQVLDSNHVPLSAISKAMSLQGSNVDEEELECFVANLIYQSRIKGYISRNHGILVVSKKTSPFPLVRSGA
eukprot:Clim_evm4s49 gene=Clim_evmTU4s49